MGVSFRGVSESENSSLCWKSPSNIDPVSCLRHCIPPQENSLDNKVDPLKLKSTEDPLRDMFEELGLRFEEKLLTVATHFAESELKVEDNSVSMEVLLVLIDGKGVEICYSTSYMHSTMVQVSGQELQRQKSAYV